MEKVKIRPSPYMPPMPTILVGANVNGKPNFMTISFCGGLQYKPPMLIISSGKLHHTAIGIKENQTFSVNIPSTSMVEVTDFLGVKSGKNVDKSNVFDVFYGELETAPMIKETPINHECKVKEILDFSRTHYFIIGEVVQTYVNEDCMTKGKPDIQKIDPIIFSSIKELKYLKVGEVVGEAYKSGNNYIID